MKSGSNEHVILNSDQRRIRMRFQDQFIRHQLLRGHDDLQILLVKGVCLCAEVVRHGHEHPLNLRCPAGRPNFYARRDDLHILEVTVRDGNVRKPNELPGIIRRVSRVLLPDRQHLGNFWVVPTGGQDDVSCPSLLDDINIEDTPAVDAKHNLPRPSPRFEHGGCTTSPHRCGLLLAAWQLLFSLGHLARSLNLHLLKVWRPFGICCIFYIHLHHLLLLLLRSTVTPTHQHVGVIVDVYCKCFCRQQW
mmetsp:Transcript_41303/g.76859  ORF Transcript_41303/g.76859 Transcript_41303/m.76859 type:complete len:248 (-) Transcript_41303:110-853(-)